MQNYYNFICHGIVDAIRIPRDCSASSARTICIERAEVRVACDENNTVLNRITNTKSGIRVAFKNVISDRSYVRPGLECIPKPHEPVLFLKRFPCFGDGGWCCEGAANCLRDAAIKGAQFLKSRNIHTGSAFKTTKKVYGNSLSLTWPCAYLFKQFLRLCGHIESIAYDAHNEELGI